MRTGWLSIGALFVAVFGVLMGNGVMTTLVPVRAALEGFAKTDIGLMGAAYFLGMLAGAMVAPRLVRAIGPIPAFALSSTLGTAVLIVAPMIVHPWSWILLRGLSGFSLAGIYAVVESYVQASAENRYRGRLLALYSIMQYGGWAAGGQLMRVDAPTSALIFHVAAAVIIVVGILPLVLVDRSPRRASTGSPPPPRGMDIRGLYRASPIGVVVTVMIGTANGPFWSLTPVFATDIGLSGVAAGTLMTLTTIGAAAFQFPVGRLSDGIDRRYVLVGLTAGAAIIEVILFLLGARLIGLPLLALGFVLGGLIATQYYTASAHTNDRVGPERAVNVAAALLFLYSIGAITGPLTASLAMQAFGPGALFLHNAALHVAVALFVLWRILQRPPPERQQAASSTAAAVEA